MEEKILNILLDMQIDMKDLKTRVINIEENEIPSMKASIKNIEENEIPNIKTSINDLTITVRNIAKKEIPAIKKSIKNLTVSVKNIENNELPKIRQQRLIDSNNIAKILNLQTELNGKIKQHFQEQAQLKIYK